MVVMPFSDCWGHCIKLLLNPDIDVKKKGKPDEGKQAKHTILTTINIIRFDSLATRK
jgi:hypothetical protein